MFERLRPGVYLHPDGYRVCIKGRDRLEYHNGTELAVVEVGFSPGWTAIYSQTLAWSVDGVSVPMSELDHARVLKRITAAMRIEGNVDVT